MNASIAELLKLRIQQFSYVVRVGGLDQETRDKMSGNAKHRPGWTRLSKEEQKQLADGLRENMNEWAKGLLTQ